jgi:hypothetical protein
MQTPILGQPVNKYFSADTCGDAANRAPPSRTLPQKRRDRTTFRFPSLNYSGEIQSPTLVALDKIPIKVSTAS